MTNVENRTSGQTRIVWVAMVLYVLSFVLYAVSDDPSLGRPVAKHPLRGWHCAVGAFVTPLGSFVWGHFRSEGLLVGVYKGNPLLLVATVFSGLINPLFLITLVQVLRHRQRSVGYLRIGLALMVVCSAIVIHAHSLVPREGFVLWIVGMLLVAWSDDLARLLPLDQRLR